jgi:nucleoside transporter
MSQNNTSGPAPTASTLKINISLAVMMFMQFMLVAVWNPQLSAYLGAKNFDKFMTGLILAAMPIGTMASPIVCALAGRFLSAQKVLAITNLLTAGFLFAAGYFEHSPVTLFVVILLAMICYMPSWALTSSIAMTHAKPENFPRIRTFGTIGWVASGLFGLASIHIFHVKPFDATHLPFLCGAGIALCAAVLNLTLPDTPPAKNAGKFSLGEVLGLKAFSLLRDKNYLIFLIGTFAATIAFVFYFSLAAKYLQAKGIENITLTLNWGQAAEMIFMFLTTTILTKFGVKKALLFGLLAMTARYLSFYFGDTQNIESLYILGILFHGLIFGWFFAGGQVYTDNKAPKELRAQAQGMFSFVVWGWAYLIGVFLFSYLIEKVTTFSTLPDETLGGAIHAVTDWSTLFLGTAIASFAIFLFFLFFFKEEKKA